MLDCPTGEIDAAAMRLLVLRHAKAEKAEAGMPDRGRRLNARGLRDGASFLISTAKGKHVWSVTSSRARKETLFGARSIGWTANL